MISWPCQRSDNLPASSLCTFSMLRTELYVLSSLLAPLGIRTIHMFLCVLLTSIMAPFFDHSKEIYSEPFAEHVIVSSLPSSAEPLSNFSSFKNLKTENKGEEHVIVTLTVSVLLWLKGILVKCLNLKNGVLI